MSSQCLTSWRYGLGLLVALSLMGCRQKGIEGSRNIVREQRQVDDFHAVTLRGFGEIFLEPGQRNELEIEAEDNMLPLLISEVISPGLLEIGFQPGANVRPRRPVQYHLQTHTLDAISLIGMGQIHAVQPLRFQELEIEAAGNVDINFESVTSNALVCRLTGTGTFKARGMVDRLTLLLGGDVNVRARALKARTIEIEMTGGNEASVWATETLVAKGRGKIRYEGNPKITAEPRVQVSKSDL